MDREGGRGQSARPLETWKDTTMEYSSAQIADILSLGLNTDAEAVIAVDTEYLGTHTLTVQAAGRIDQDTVAVQVYKSPAVPDLPAGFEAVDYLKPERYGQL